MGEINLSQAQLPVPGLSPVQTEITDLKTLKVGAGSHIFLVDDEAIKIGNANIDDAPIVLNYDGTAKFKTPDGQTILDTSDPSGDYINIINTALNTSSKKILTDFTFEATDYAGAFKTGNPTWNTTTGLPTGGTGVLINAKGIMGVNSGSTVFSIDVDGNATFAGTLSAPSGTLGTITAGTITGATIQTGTSGNLTKIDSNNIRLYNGSTQTGVIRPDADKSVVIGSKDDVYFTDLSGTPFCRISSGGNIYMKSDSSQIYWPSGRYLYADASVIYCNGDFIASSGIRGDAYSVKPGSTTYTGDTETSIGFVTNVRLNEGNIEKKYRVFDVRGGIVTNVTDEGSWTS